MAENRFEVVLEEGGMTAPGGWRTVLRDTETGVCYLVVQSPYGGGIAPLLNEFGKPLTE